MSGVVRERTKGRIYSDIYHQRKKSLKMLSYSPTLSASGLEGTTFTMPLVLEADSVRHDLQDETLAVPA